MASLTDQKDSSFVKTLLLGESKSGKTGALAALVAAGYKLFIVDFEAGLDYLADEIRAKDPELLKNVVFETFRDKTKLSPTKDIIPVGRPKAFDQAMKALDQGIDNTGPPGELGENWVVVIDSLWSAGRAAFLEHAKSQPTKDPRQTFYGAQKMLMAMLENLTLPEFRAHVIVISHMTLIELESGQVKGMPAAIGKAVSAEIPKLFNRMLATEVKGSGKNARRVIATVPTTLIPATSGALKDKVPAELPLETGLATFFQLIRGKNPGE